MNWNWKFWQKRKANLGVRADSRPEPNTTTDRNDPRLHYGYDTKPTPQHDIYYVLSEEELKKRFVLPVRQVYIHKTCGTKTKMSLDLAESYAAAPHRYGSSYCLHCQMHRPHAEFVWDRSLIPMGSDVPKSSDFS